jgi:hypothetical protein
MKKLFQSIVFALIFLSNFQNVNSQNCEVSQQDVTKGTMGKKTDKAVFIGQSFKACKTGNLIIVSFSIGGGNMVKNVELRIFEDTKIDSEPVYKMAVKLPTPDLPLQNYEDVLKFLDNGGFPVEEGKTYTVGFFKPKLETKELLRFKSDNTNSFEDGSLVANSKLPGGDKQNKDIDLVFSFTIN